MALSDLEVELRLRSTLELHRLLVIAPAGVVYETIEREIRRREQEEAGA